MLSVSRTWREQLGVIIDDPMKAEELSKALRVHPMTLKRWRIGESTPRPQMFRQLLNLLPEQREQLFTLYEQEFEGALTQSTVPQEIPSAFYGQVLRALAVTPEPICFWTICSIILQQAIKQIDPERLGMEIVVIRCAPPGEDKKLHSLQESVGVGTPPWRADFAERRRFLGIESLAGHVVTTGRYALVQSIQENNSFFSAGEGEHAMSCAAFPIRLAGCIAGCMLISSVIPYYFHPSRLTLIERYADLLVLAFLREDFYEPDAIEIRPMPPLAVQQPYLNTFSRSVARVLRATAEQEKPIRKRQAERMVWQEIEAALLRAE